MLISLHMFMYLKLIDVKFVLIIHVHAIILKPVFLAKVQTKHFLDTNINILLFFFTV